MVMHNGPPCARPRLFADCRAEQGHRRARGKGPDLSGDLVLRAKLDTGARNSSLHAPGITKFEKNGETWVRFSVKDHRGKEATIERKLVRQATIKQKAADPEKRPVIMLGICMGRQYREVEVNLVDRANFNYPMLIGRSFMSGHFVVDPELKYTAEPACVGAPAP